MYAFPFYKHRHAHQTTLPDGYPERTTRARSATSGHDKALCTENSKPISTLKQLSTRTR